MNDKELRELIVTCKQNLISSDAVLPWLWAADLIELLEELAKLRSKHNKPTANPSTLSMVERYLSGGNEGVYLAFQVFKNPELGRHDLIVMAQSDFIGAAQTKWTTRVDLNRIEEIPRKIAEGIVSEAVHLAVTKVLPVVEK